MAVTAALSVVIVVLWLMRGLVLVVKSHACYKDLQSKEHEKRRLAIKEIEK